MDIRLTRRGFTKGSAAVAAASAAAAIPMATGIPAAKASEESETSYMDYEGSQRPWSFEVAPDSVPEDQITRQETAEVVVVGGGTSGLCCALSAAQSGLTVRLISRSEGPVARGGSNFAVYSKHMEEVGAPRWDPELEMRAHMLHGSFAMDTRKWYRFYNTSEEAMNWLIDEMAAEGDGYEPVLELGGYGMPSDDPMRISTGAHGWSNGELKGSQGQPHVVQVLAKHLEAAGGAIDWQTTATQLVRETGGRVQAVVAYDVDGNYVRYNASKAVVLATGDFSGNRDMVARYAPMGLEMFSNWDQEIDPDNARFGGMYQGDGQRMGLWVGAAWQKSFPCPIMFTSGRAPGASKPCVMLDSTGHRFWAEERTEGIYGMVQWNNPGKVFYHVWAKNYAYDFPYTATVYGGDPVDPEEQIESWRQSIDGGELVCADTVEELVEAMGLPDAAVEEIARYNEFCANGEDLDFHKRKEFLIGLNEGPFYGVKVDKFNFLTVIGGLRTNANMQVCDADDEPIPGLYNVGTMVGDSMTNAYTFQIPGFNLGMNCVTFGYDTGKYIAENE